MGHIQLLNLLNHPTKDALGAEVRGLPFQSQMIHPSAHHIHPPVHPEDVLSCTHSFIHPPSRYSVLQEQHCAETTWWVGPPPCPAEAQSNKKDNCIGKDNSRHSRLGREVFSVKEARSRVPRGEGFLEMVQAGGGRTEGCGTSVTGKAKVRRWWRCLRSDHSRVAGEKEGWGEMTRIGLER